jgi:hypothetical protein
MHWLFAALLVAMALWGSVFFAAPSSTTTILSITVIGILLLGRHLYKVADRLPEPTSTLLLVLYYILPHLEFYDLRSVVIHNWPARDWGMIALATIYAAAYSSIFLLMAWAGFRRRPLIQ